MAGIEVSRSIFINRSAEDLYGFWHNFENCRLFIDHLESVKQIGDGVTRWTLNPHLGFQLTWDSRVTEDIKDRQISWQSLPDSGIVNKGVVSFNEAPENKGTEVALNISYELPEGFSNIIEKTVLDIVITRQIDRGLQRLKTIMEDGREINE